VLRDEVRQGQCPWAARYRGARVRSARRAQVLDFTFPVEVSPAAPDCRPTQPGGDCLLARDLRMYRALDV
jgi:hypothetical protein